MSRSASSAKRFYWWVVRWCATAVRFLFRHAPKYFRDRIAFKKAGGVITHFYPILADFGQPAGSARGHYFHQDLLVAHFVHQVKPKRHVDVGSRIDGFIAHVATFRPVDVMDIRPMHIIGHEQITFVQSDIMQLDECMRESTDSLSCLHALEHFGLGRYGDPIDPDGHLKGFRNLHSMLKPLGTLYLSVPIGERSVHFNAHRVFSPQDVLDWSVDLFELIRFDYVDDSGALHKNCAPRELPATLSYGCGIYTLKKISPAA